MAIPDYETLMLPLLKTAAEANGQEVPLISTVDKLANHFKLTEEDRRELLPSGGTF
jgi:restriction system protein